MGGKLFNPFTIGYQGVIKIAFYTSRPNREGLVSKEARWDGCIQEE